MEANNIIKKIKEIAEELSKNGQPITRADLAYELKNKGFECDSFAITEWVWKAYTFYGSDEHIRQSFVNNNRKNYLVDEYGIFPVLIDGNYSKLSELLTKILLDSKNALSNLDSNVSIALEEIALKGTSDLIGRVTGTKGVADVQANASLTLDRYTDLVKAYADAKDDVKTIISTFIAIRSYVDETYRRYALALTDIFGDSIKAVSPELFDFDSIQWLDVKGMLENVQLEFNQLMNRCGELMSSISNNFTASLKMASASYRLVDNKKVGLFLAGVAMIDHYLDVNQQTNQLKSQLLTLKKTVKRDATQIKGDMARLTLIYKGMNDYHIPRAEAFYRYSHQIMEDDFNALLTSLYSNPQVATLKKERDNLLKELANLSCQLSDSQMNIDYYHNHISECTSLIDSMESQYNEAKACKPEKPLFLWNLFTFGSAATKYNRKMASWYQTCHPVIKQYEALKVDISLDKEDLTSHQRVYTEGIQKMEDLNKRFQESTQAMQKALQVDVVTKKKIMYHLENLIKLLKVAKEILHTKLDEKLLNAVTIPDYTNEKLPAEILQHLHLLSQSFSEMIETDHHTAKSSLDELARYDKDVSDNVVYTDEELNMVANAQSQVLQKALSIFESWADLQKRHHEGKLIARKYDEELQKLQEQFQREISAIDDKSKILYQAIQQLKTSQESSVIRNALLSLANIDDAISDQDWEDFFNGRKTIMI